MGSVQNKERYSKFEAAVIEGKAYSVFVSDVTLADTETLNVAFKTPSTKDVHLWVVVSTRIMGYWEVLEGEAWTTGTGVQKTIYNKDRNSDNKSSVLGDQTSTFVEGEVAENVTGLDGEGIVIDQRNLGGSINGGNLYIPCDLDEILLKQDQTYVIRYTSSANSNGALMALIWYEE